MQITDFLPDAVDYTMLMSMLGREVEHWDCSPSERSFKFAQQASPVQIPEIELFNY